MRHYATPSKTFGNPFQHSGVERIAAGSDVRAGAPVGHEAPPGGASFPLSLPPILPLSLYQTLPVSLSPSLQECVNSQIGSGGWDRGGGWRAGKGLCPLIQLGTTCLIPLQGYLAHKKLPRP